MSHVELEKCNKPGCDVQVICAGCCGDEVNVICNKCDKRLEAVTRIAVKDMWASELKRDLRNDN